MLAARDREIVIKISSFIAGLGWLVEGDVDVLKAFAALGFGHAGVGASVASGELDVVGKWREQRPRMKALDTYDVCLNAQTVARAAR